LYWQYYQGNRWRFANRTETATKVDPKDFRTWDLKTIFKETEKEYILSYGIDSITKKRIQKKEIESIETKSIGKLFKKPLIIFKMKNGDEYPIEYVTK